MLVLGMTGEGEGGQIVDRGREPLERYAGGEAGVVVGRADDGGASGNDTVPGVPEAHRVVDLAVVGGGVDDVADVLDSEGDRGHLRDGDVAVRNVDLALTDEICLAGRAFLEHGEVARG